MNAFAKWAAHLLLGGYSPMPIRADNGLPAIKHWDDLRTKPLSAGSITELARKRPDLQLAVIGGFNGLVPIDIDTNDPAIIAAVERALPPAVVKRKGSKGYVAFYWDPHGVIAGRKYQTPAPMRTVLVEVLSTTMVTIPPSLHRKTGKPYDWLTRPKTLLNTRVVELSVITPGHIEALTKALEPWVPKQAEFVRPVIDNSTLVNDKRRQAYAKRVLDAEERALFMLGDGRNWGLYQAACKIGKYVHHKHITEAEVVTALMRSCEGNGYRAKAGSKQALETIKSGLKKSRGDSLPNLANRARCHRSDQRATEKMAPATV